MALISIQSSYYKRRSNISPNNAGITKKQCRPGTDRNLGKVVYISIIYHMPDSNFE